MPEEFFIFKCLLSREWMKWLLRRSNETYLSSSGSESKSSSLIFCVDFTGMRLNKSLQFWLTRTSNGVRSPNGSPVRIAVRIELHRKSDEIKDFYRLGRGMVEFWPFFLFLRAPFESDQNFDIIGFSVIFRIDWWILARNILSQKKLGSSKFSLGMVHFKASSTLFRTLGSEIRNGNITWIDKNLNQLKLWLPQFSLWHLCLVKLVWLGTFGNPVTGKTNEQNSKV